MRFINNFRFLKNFYVATGLGLVVWVCFFAQNDIIGQFTNWRKLGKLEDEKQQYIEQIKLLKKEQLQTLGTDQLLEKFAREKYYMKKPTEDVFVLVDENGEEVEK
jgi:cell division protein DivIC